MAGQKVVKEAVESLSTRLSKTMSEATAEMGSAADKIIQGFEKNADGSIKYMTESLDTLSSALSDYRQKHTPNYMIDEIRNAAKGNDAFGAYARQIDSLTAPGKKASDRTVDNYRKQVNEIYREFDAKRAEINAPKVDADIPDGTSSRMRYTTTSDPDTPEMENVRGRERRERQQELNEAFRSDEYERSRKVQRDKRYKEYKEGKADVENVRGYNSGDIQKRAGETTEEFNKRKQDYITQQETQGNGSTNYRERELKPITGDWDDYKGNTTKNDFDEFYQSQRDPGGVKQKEAEARLRQEKVRKASEAAAIKDRAAKENKQRQSYEQSERERFFNEHKERSWLGGKMHNLGEGIKGVFGVQDVITGSNGQVLNKRGSRVTRRTQLNDLNYGAKVVNGMEMTSMNQFDEQYQAIKDGLAGNFKGIEKMQQSSNFDGLGDWAKEHPMLVAGAVAGTTVGAASIIGNMRDGD